VDSAGRQLPAFFSPPAAARAARLVASRTIPIPLTEPGAIEAAMERARALVQARDLDGAARACAEILALDPARADAWFMRGVIHAECRDARQARAHLTRAFELQPSQSPANHLVYANVLLEAGELRAAEIEARKVFAASPWLAPALGAHAHATLARVLIARGNFGEAVAILQAGLARLPGDAALAHQLAYARQRLAGA